MPTPKVARLITDSAGCLPGLRDYSQSSQCVTASGCTCGTHAAAGYDARWRAGAGTLATVRVVITEIGWDGNIRRRAVGTGSLVRGFAANRLTGCPVKLARTRRVAISTPSAAGPQRIRRAGEYCGHAPGFNPERPSGGTLVTAVSCGARLASPAAGGWFRWPHIDWLSWPGGLRSGANQVRRAGDGRLWWPRR